MGGSWGERVRADGRVGGVTLRVSVCTLHLRCPNKNAACVLGSAVKLQGQNDFITITASNHEEDEEEKEEGAED